MGVMGAIKKGIIPFIPHYKKGFSRENELYQLYQSIKKED